MAVRAIRGAIQLDSDERGHLLKSAVIAAAFSGGVYLLYVKVALGSLPPLPFLE